MKHDVFISYSRKDSNVVKQIVKEISAHGYSAWMDIDGIESGDEFKTKIVSAIKESKVFIFFSSKDSNISEWTVKEVNIAVTLRKPIIPIKLDNTVYNDSILFDLSGIDHIFIGDKLPSDISKLILRSLKKKLGANTQAVKDKTIYFKAKNGFELQNVCGEHILVAAGVENVDFSRIISLNPTAAFLWEKMSSEESFTIDDMVNALLEEYDVEERVAREDCCMIVERWKEMDLIEE